MAASGGQIVVQLVKMKRHQLAFHEVAREVEAPAFLVEDRDVGNGEPRALRGAVLGGRRGSGGLVRRVRIGGAGLGGGREATAR